VHHVVSWVYSSLTNRCSPGSQRSLSRWSRSHLLQRS
jgi:hypothetical protein